MATSHGVERRVGGSLGGFCQAFSFRVRLCRVCFLPRHSERCHFSVLIEVDYISPWMRDGGRETVTVVIFPELEPIQILLCARLRRVCLTFGGRVAENLDHLLLRHPDVNTRPSRCIHLA